MKVKKLADGGTGLITFRSSQTPWSPPTMTSSKQDSSGSESILDDEMYKMLINKGGLKNDVDAFANKINSLNTNTFLSGSGQARRLFAEINTLRVNKEMWDSTLKQAQEKGGLNEVAVGSSGEMYVRDAEGNIGAVTIDKFDPRKHRALTISDLLIERQYSPELVNNQSIFTIANNSEGLDSIVSRINNIVGMAGKESETSETFLNKSEIPAGAQEQLKQLGAVIGSPSSDVKITAKVESERGRFQEAYRYIWNTLGRSAQLKLKAVAAMNGNGTRPEDIISDALLFGTDYSKSVTVDEQKRINGVSTSESGTGTSGMNEIKPLEYWTGQIINPGTFLWNDSGLKMNLPTTLTAPLIYENGQVIGPATVSKILYESPFGSITVPEKTYFGDKQMSTDDKDKVVYDAASAARVYMPVNDDGSPNYNLLRSLEEVKKQINPSWTTRQINDFYAGKGLDVKVNERGEFIESSEMKPFIIFYGYAEDGTRATKDNQEIDKLMDGKDRNIASSLMESVWKNEKKKDMKSGWMNTYYKGIVAMPLNGKFASVMAASMSGNGPKYKAPTREQTAYQLQTTSRGNVASNQFELN